VYHCILLFCSHCGKAVSHYPPEDCQTCLYNQLYLCAGGSFSGSACSSRSTSPSSSAHSLIPTVTRAGGPYDKHLPNTR
jgi:hypothetical protein